MGWLQAMRRRNPGAPLRRIAWWMLVRTSVWLALWALYRLRWWGAARLPATGPVLLIGNHQSFLDLVAIGAAIPHRHFHSMARSGLFHNRWFGWFIRSLNAFAVDQNRGDIKAIRTAIELLKAGQLVLVFPEGSRCESGELAEFQEGILLLVRRARPTVVPIAIDGAYDAWPRWRKLPRLCGRIGLSVGRPIPADELLALSPELASRRLASEVERLRLETRAKLRRASCGRFPPPGAGDRPAAHVNLDLAQPAP